ncbi:hypothetical protein P8452_13169 [Trifolium repens]|nr:hypothetical protein P8452_13169 [Trifolium repens]
MIEEATNGNPWAPNTVTLRSISKAAFELDDYWRIIEILHKRLAKFEKKNWRISYNSLIVLEHLLTHGPESVAEEFQSGKDVINQLKGFQYIDQQGCHESVDSWMCGGFQIYWKEENKSRALHREQKRICWRASIC